MASGDEVRAVLRRQPAGVVVVTVDLEGARLGLTVASFVSLALEPPLVGISVARQAALHELLRAAGRFAVSLLAADQVEVARHFARGVPPLVMWQGIETRADTHAPLLVGAVGWLECAVAGEHEAGDHTFFVGRVERAEPGAPGPALVRVDGDYA